MAPTYVKIQPSLPVSSIQDAIDYYTGRLGFRLAGRDSDDHCWIQLVNDESVSKWDAPVNIYLRRRGFPDIPEDVQFGKVYIRLEGDEDELEKLAEKLKTNKANVVGDIVTKPWGLKDLTVEDPDGIVKGYQLPANTIFLTPPTKKSD
ncbi:hypothetical protein SLS53_001090 [Cytospora paraplurivora]|uniref:VOC domain-containing protein n=1 Tax=Cytospora paraplurivora TaxID=2898453 RepID=A0AAN9UIU3_9PEZI